MTQNKSILDFGCGCGACGIAAIKQDAKKVVFNDIDTSKFFTFLFDKVLKFNSKQNYGFKLTIF